MGFKENIWNYKENERPFDGLLSTASAEGFSVSAISVPEDSIVSQDKPFDFIELPGGMECVIAISDEYLNGLAKNATSDFNSGFRIGMFVNQILTEKLEEMVFGDF